MRATVTLEPTTRDGLLFEDILKHRHGCFGHFEGVDRDAYRKDGTFRLITERLLETVGQAASGISYEARAAAEYDWRVVCGLRNVLAHKYGHANHGHVWSTVREDLPDLMRRMDEALD